MDLKKVILSFVIGLSIVLYYFISSPIIWITDEIKDLESINFYKKGDTINPLKDYNFDDGKWAAYLVISRNDYNELSDEVPAGRLFKCTDIKVLKKMQSLKFIYTNSDLATVDSQFLLCQNNKLVFKSGIVLDNNNQGFQNSRYGWIKAYPLKSFSQCVKSFYRFYSPVLIVY